jgi:hypothetical protein
MQTGTSESVKKVRVPLILAVILIAGNVFAQDGPVSREGQQIIETQAQERLRSAIPKPFPERTAIPKPFPEVLGRGAELGVGAEATLPSDACPELDDLSDFSCWP